MTSDWRRSWRRWLAWAMGLALLALWCAHFVDAWRVRGWFSWLGFDYAYFAAIARAGMAGGPRAMYDVSAIGAASAEFTTYYVGSGRPLVVPPPWPPLFFVLFAPIAALPPVAGYVSWTLLNLGAATYTISRLAERFRHPSYATVLCGLSFLPVPDTLFFGQPSILWMLAFYKAYRAFEQQREFEAGLWLGSLLIKPQYALFFGLALLYKARWGALAGMAAVGAALALSTLALLGWSGTVSYFGAVRALSGFRVTEPLIAPEQMISWRGLLLNLLPASTTDAQGTLLVAALSALTAATLLVVWRGPWRPRGSRFAVQVLATTLVTMLASFHNHVHGATLLLVPGMALLASGGGPILVRWLGWALLLVPPLVFLPTNNPIYLADSFIAIMTLALLVITASTWSPRPLGCASGAAAHSQDGLPVDGQ